MYSNQKSISVTYYINEQKYSYYYWNAVKRKIPVILSGKIVDLNGNNIEGVIIEVKKLDYNYTPCKITNLCSTISKKDGAYSICLQKQCDVDYKLCMYPPLIRE
ncbi:hypothetical protein [Clostridium psychrophilum]|uniref:hypothetical protein n=1 Tax=Clostridium psychrophilum TaxID=132926 RepID=UPI001C0D2FF0|nr:hypothetical protein [Clostridium psychrophilum]MBU3181567.1 hypothetical protein [Clostridium psychrophilum]